jgi:hypothetical protein
LKNVHLRRCASSFVIATYAKIRLIPQDLCALHLGVFEQPSKFGWLFFFIIAGLNSAIQLIFSKILLEIQLIIAYS